MRNKRVAPFDHDHNKRPECAEHNARLHNMGKANGNAGKAHHSLPLDKAQAARQHDLDVASQQKAERHVLLIGPSGKRSWRDEA